MKLTGCRVSLGESAVTHRSTTNQNEHLVSCGSGHVTPDSAAAWCLLRPPYNDKLGQNISRRAFREAGASPISFGTRFQSTALQGPVTARASLHTDADYRWRWGKSCSGTGRERSALDSVRRRRFSQAAYGPTMPPSSLPLNTAFQNSGWGADFHPHFAAEVCVTSFETD